MFLCKAKVIPVYDDSSDLLSVVLEETGGLGVDIVVDSGGKHVYAHLCLNQNFNPNERFHEVEQAFRGLEISPNSESNRTTFKLTAEHLTVCIYEVRLQEEEEGSEGMKLLPHKHDIISVLGVGGHWVTSHKQLQVNERQDTKTELYYKFSYKWKLPKRLKASRRPRICNSRFISIYFICIFVFSQLDPPDCRSLYFKSASVTFLNHEVWTASSAQQGRYLRILTSQHVIQNMCTLKDPHIPSLTGLHQIFWKTLWRRCPLEYSGKLNSPNSGAVGICVI